eukprot:SAG11_NODE_4914_length_1724_cov_1.330462_2_plen_276_part_00
MAQAWDVLAARIIAGTGACKARQTTHIVTYLVSVALEITGSCVYEPISYMIRGAAKDFDEDYDNPVSEESDFSPEVRTVPKDRSTLGSSVSTFDSEDSERVPKGRSSAGKAGKAGKRARRPSAIGNTFDVEETSISTKTQARSDARVMRTAQFSKNRMHEGVLPDENFTGMKDLSQNNFLEITDWTTVTDKARLQVECKERGLPTSGRAFQFGMAALQNQLNKFDAREREVNYTASHVDNFTFDRDKSWRDRAGGKTDVQAAARAMSARTTGATR